MQKRPAKFVEQSLAALTERCGERGVPLTPQRLTIYRVLLESMDHPGPDALFERVKPRLPQVSLATIYKTLDTLVSLGVVSELPATGATRRFDANMAPHHHLVCSKCEAVEDFHHSELSALKLPKGLNGFSPTSLSIHVQGVCRSCA